MNSVLVTIKKCIPQGLFAKLQPVYHWLMNLVAAVVYGFPSEKMIVVGVTGTTGKTTVVYMLAQILASAGVRVGYTSTAMFGDGEREWLNDKKMTMLGRFFTQRILRKMVSNGCQVAIVETTSEGIRQFRHRFINYDICVFTGIYPEHIESHGSFESYKAEKLKLFAHLARCKGKKFAQNFGEGLPENIGENLRKLPKAIVVNGNDEYAHEFLEFDVTDKSKVHAPEAVANANGWEFEFAGVKMKLPLLGEFNVFNAVLAAMVAQKLGLSSAQIAQGLASISGIPGRLEKITIPVDGGEFAVVVDYAFEPVAMTKLYQTIEVLSPKQIIHVLGGTGGGRDKGRRSKIGAIAGAKADKVIVTNEDPYDEDPQEIIDAVFAGVLADKSNGKQEDKNCWRILNRTKAIQKALQFAQSGDVILITGKGCEQTICIADGKTISHDDRGVVHRFTQRNLLQKKNYRK